MANLAVQALIEIKSVQRSRNFKFSMYEYALYHCLLQDFCIWDLVLPPNFKEFSLATRSGNCLVFWHCVGILSRSRIAHKRVGSTMYSLVDFQLSVNSDSIPLPDILAKSAKCYNGFRSSSSNLIINVHCCGESASKNFR